MQRELAETLSGAKWLSVRDSITKKWLLDLGLNAFLTPDIATLFSKYYPRALNGIGQDECVIQIGHGHLSAHFQDLIAAVTARKAEFKTFRVMVAGIAYGHDRFADAMSLAMEINKRVPGTAFVDFELDPVKIAQRIGAAKFVYSSSLHFQIVAMSYGVRSIGFGPLKMKQYIEDWAFSSRFIDSFAKHDLVLDQLLSLENQRIHEKSEMLKAQTSDAWFDMVANIEGAK
jgi:polysaccharide pyruvyl transferase WcaK-like protein